VSRRLRVDRARHGGARGPSFGRVVRCSPVKPDRRFGGIAEGDPKRSADGRRRCNSTTAIDPRFRVYLRVPMTRGPTSDDPPRRKRRLLGFNDHLLDVI
jgi:hypothetical protein